MKKRKNKKKAILVLLLVFTFIGIAGYGVYSYYWAQGSVTHNGTITVDGFDVTLYGGVTGGSHLFIHGSFDSESLQCEYDSEETFICSDYITVTNNSTKNVSIDISNLDVTVSGITGAELTNSSMNCGNGLDTLSSGDSASCDIILQVAVPGYVVPSVEATRLTEPITGGELEVTASYTIKATEVHD